nr:acyl-CoA dehydrogenase family protein [Effusibacillus dendaii]
MGANLTMAVPDPEQGEGVYRLTGEKFFASNAGAMVATVLARINPELPGTKGLGLFLVPWIKPDGQKNQIYVRRLKEKLGVNAVPSAEVILEDAEGYLIGDADKGFKYMAEALNISRICNAIASLGIMRRAFYEAVQYASGRKAFGKPIIQYSMVQETLADLLVELEVNTGSCFEMIHYFDKMVTDQAASEDEKAMARFLIPLLKYRTGELAIKAAHQSLETHGGNGFIEEYVTPRLLRDSQVLTVWEGTANILALDLVRVMKKENGHQSFFRILTRDIAALQNPLSEPFKPVLRSALQEIQESLQQIWQQSEAVMTYHLKAFADYLVDVFQLVQILKEAEDQAKQDGNGRKFIVAYLFRKRHFDRPSHRGLLDTHLADLAFFEELVSYQTIPVAAATNFFESSQMKKTVPN